MTVEISAEGRTPEPHAAVIPRLLRLIEELSDIPGIHARLDVTVTITMPEVIE